MKLRRYIGRRVLVNTTSGEAFDGTLTALVGDALVLEHAEVVEPRKLDLSGEVVIPGDRVTWMQVV